ISDAAAGLTAVVGVAVGPDRNLYVSEIFSQFDLSTTPPTPRPGRVRRVAADGSSQIVLDGLATPNGIAFDRSRTLYVAVNSAFTAPGAQGQLLRCERVATPVPGLPRTGAGPAPATRSLGGLIQGAGLTALAAAGAALLLLGRRAARLTAP